jgi:uncharacterized protein DUF1488
MEPEGWYIDAGPPWWDAEAKTFSFFLRKLGRAPVTCMLAMDALENAAQSSDLSEPALSRIFDAHRLMIELRAAQKLNAGLLDADGCVLLGADDLGRRTDGAQPCSDTRDGQRESAGTIFMAITAEDFYRSSNGDRWQLIRDSASGRSFVRHEPNLSSGGRTTDTDVDEFLNRTGSSPENLALRALLDKHARTDGS